MISKIGWVDYSSEHRSRVFRVIELLSTPGTVDELGIGVIRNAFSNRLFPGISTIQTRAKYFIIIPRILRDFDDLPDRQKHDHPLHSFLTDSEEEVMRILVNHHKTDNEIGIFGSDTVERGGHLQRQPSSVYWTGLRQFGIVQTLLTLGEFIHQYGSRRRDEEHRVRASEMFRGDDEDAFGEVEQHVELPDHKPDWKENLSIHLTAQEAEFLQNTICQNVPESLVARILTNDETIREFLKLDGYHFDDLLTLNWMHDQDNGNPDLISIVQAASDFWRIMEGAHIRYNQLLQINNSAGDDPWLEEWKVWKSDVPSDRLLWSRWDTGQVWTIVQENGSTLKPATRNFVENWVAASSNGAHDDDELDRIVRQQERANKGKRARLRPGGESVKEGDWLGLDGLNYRLLNVRRIVGDIARGLEIEDAK